MFKIVSDLTCIHCDSGVRAEGGSIDRFSSKVSFMRRLTSCIVEYALSFEILHFHYDLWLFKCRWQSVGHNRSCSPAKSLETKSFSVEYWKWQHPWIQQCQHLVPPLPIPATRYGSHAHAGLSKGHVANASKDYPWQYSMVFCRAGSSSSFPTALK